MEQNEKIVSPMSNEGRNAYVVEQLTGALLALLQEKPLADISVSQLCDKAGVGRTSFYRNYQAGPADPGHVHPLRGAPGLLCPAE